MNHLSQKTKKVISHYFPTEKEWAEAKLVAFCESLSEYLTECTTAESYERFCLAVLKIGKTSKEKFLGAIKLGKTDYRDLFVAAGFGNSTTIHNDWALNLTKPKT
jgi:hypothetical protein